MKVLHVPFTYYPDASGGTEVYVRALAREAAAHAIESAIVAPGDADRAYVHDGIRVERFGLGRSPTLRERYGAGDPVAAEKFVAILARIQPDLVHLHAFTMGASLLMAQAARDRHIPVVFTYHTPTASCIRGTLMHEGRGVCDGVMHTRRCASCALQTKGTGRATSRLLASLPPALGTWIGTSGRTGAAWTALRYTELTELRHRAFRELLLLAARVVVPCIWAWDLLVRNGVSERKLLLSRQGLAQADHQPPAHSMGRRERAVGERVRLAFLGRFSEEKGVDLVVQALRAHGSDRLSLDLYGGTQGIEGDRYKGKLRSLANGDQRVRFLAPIASDSVVATLREYDALVVPSRWLETGPLVILEAFAAGIPVIGSDLGGIAELVTHNVNGLLVPPDSAAWNQVLEVIARDPTMLMRLRDGITPPRRMEQVAAEMSTLYREIARVTSASAARLENSLT